MVELVLCRPGIRPFEVVDDAFAALVLPFEPDAHGTLDRREHALERQATLVVDLDVVASTPDHWVDDRMNPAVAGCEHEQTAKDPDLRRGEANADCVLHQRRHPHDQLLQVVVELLHRMRLHPQHRIGVLTDLRKRQPTAGFALGLDSFLLEPLFGFAHEGTLPTMDRHDREAILRQGVHRPETPRDREEREALLEDLRESPLAGKPLRRRLRNFRPDAHSTVRALGGPLAWMRRLRAIETATAQHEASLGEAWEELRSEHPDDRDFTAAWRELASGWSFQDVNELIERHNDNFPAEARLPMNPRTGDFVLVNGRPYTRAPLDANWILARFPPPTS